MTDKQLGLDQYKLHHLLDIEPVSSMGEVETFLSPRPSMAAGTRQEKISDVETALTYDARYFDDTGGLDYDQFEQTELDVDVPVVREQSEITDYNSRARIASD